MLKFLGPLLCFALVLQQHTADGQGQAVGLSEVTLRRL